MRNHFGFFFNLFNRELWSQAEGNILQAGQGLLRDGSTRRLQRDGLLHLLRGRAFPAHCLSIIFAALQPAHGLLDCGAQHLLAYLDFFGECNLIHDETALQAIDGRWFYFLGDEFFLVHLAHL